MTARFMDNVVTSTIAYEGDARWREYEGGVEDWLTQSRRASEIALQRWAKTTAKPFPLRDGSELRKQEQATAQVSAQTPGRINTRCQDAQAQFQGTA
jgi:ATP-binding cassette subfamily F protein uup